MSDGLAYFGLSEDILSRSGFLPELLNFLGRASEQEIRDALNLIVPRKTGLPLVRLGGRMDGGYLLPDDITGIEACFSPGTNNFKRFEDELAKIYSIRSFMCDFSSNEEQFSTPLIQGVQFFQKKWLDIYGGSNELNLESWVNESVPGTGDLILQMDIEGAEYRNIIAAPLELLSRFRIIIIELHDLQKLQDREFLNGVFLPTLSKITKNHVSAHVHPNNCCGETEFYRGLSSPNALEITLLRKDRINSSPISLKIPNELDERNVNRQPPLHLRGVWLSEADEIRSQISSLEHSVNWLTERVITLCRVNQFLINRSELRYNLAIGKQAAQSSLSSYSTAEGPSGAINGLRTGRFGFHTEEEINPWWSVDLGSPYFITECLVFNRMDCASIRADTLQLLISMDGRIWNLVYSHAGRPTFGGVTPHDGEPPLLIELPNVEARFVKIQLNAHTALHLDEVEIFGFSDTSI